MPWSVVASNGWSGPNGGTSNPINAVGSTLAWLVVGVGAGGSTAFTVTGGGPWQLLASPVTAGSLLHVYVNLTPPQVANLQVTITGVDIRMGAWVITYSGDLPAVGAVQTALSNDTGVTLPAVFVAPSSLFLAAAVHQSPNPLTLSLAGAPPIQASGGSPAIAGVRQGLIANIPDPGSVTGLTVATWLTGPPLVAPMAAAVVVINVAPAIGPRPGVGAIANLRGKVTATHALEVSTTVALADAARTGHLDGTTKYTDAILIPAPADDEQVILTGLSASVLVAGPFSVTYRTGATAVLGPIWLPSSGAAALVTGRTFDTGPIVRALPPGQGLTVTTSVDAPQSFEATYEIVSA